MRAVNHPLFAIISTLAIVFLLTIPVTAPAPTMASTEDLVRLSIVFYGDHTPEYDTRILNIRPEYVISNLPHGIYGEVYGYDHDGLLQNIAEYQAAGIKVIGYITAGYEGTDSPGTDPYYYTLKMNKQMIRNMAEIDHVDGVFLDECSAYPDKRSKKYLRELTDLTHSYGLITWGNVGEDQFDEWFFTEGGFDLMNSTEAWHGQNLSQVQQDWGHRISVIGFKSRYTARDAFELTIDAWEKGLAYCYISSNDPEYQTIPPWCEEYVTLLRDYNQDIAPSEGATGVAPDTQPAPHLRDNDSGVNQSIIWAIVGGIVGAALILSAAILLHRRRSF